MFKFLFVVVVAVLCWFYYLDKKGFDLKEVNPSYQSKKGVPPTPTPFQKNRYPIASCVLKRNEDFIFAKIIGFNNNTNLYHYRLCHKYKGCNQEILKDNLNIFEKDFPEKQLIDCPPEIK